MTRMRRESSRLGYATVRQNCVAFTRSARCRRSPRFNARMMAAHASPPLARGRSHAPNPTRRGDFRRKRLKSFSNLCLLRVRSDSRSFRFKPQIASSDETKEIAFNGRYRQEGLYVPSSRDVRVRSAVFRHRFGERLGCRQQQSRASADDPRREDLRRGKLTGRMGVRPSTSQQGETPWRNARKQRRKRRARSAVSSAYCAS